jgi:hypothetical protein
VSGEIVDGLQEDKVSGADLTGLMVFVVPSLYSCLALIVLCHLGYSCRMFCICTSRSRGVILCSSCEN